MDREGESMELERKMKRKLLAGVGIFILLALAGTWYADEAEKSPLVLQAKQESAEKQTGTTEVIGLQQAIAGGELRNPFSFVHEREGEPVQGMLPASKNELPSAAPPAAVAAEKQSNVPAAPAISLCGIVEGNGPGMLADFQSVLTIGKVFVRYAQIFLQGIGHGIQTAVALSDKGFRLAVYLDVHGAGAGAVRFLL